MLKKSHIQMLRLSLKKFTTCYSIILAFRHHALTVSLHAKLLENGQKWLFSGASSAKISHERHISLCIFGFCIKFEN